LSRTIKNLFVRSGYKHRTDVVICFLCVSLINKKFSLILFIILSLNACSQLSKPESTALDQSTSQSSQQLIFNFIEAVKKGDMVRVESLYAGNINKADQYGRVAIVEAVKFKQIKALRFLLEKQARVDVHVNDMSLLMVAAYHNNLSAAKILIQSGARVNDTNNSKWTALHYAALLGRAEITTELIKAQADINASSKTGMTALMKSAGSNHLNNLKTLLKLGAEIELIDHKGRTALMYAVAMGRVDALSILVAAGADLKAIDGEGKTAIHLARDRKKQEVISYLNRMRQ
jgi:ankyrin repeat protein